MGGTKETIKTTTDKTGSVTGTDPGAGSGSNAGATSGTTTGATGSTGKGSTKAKANDSVYSAKELAENAKALFGVMPECVMAALKMAKVEACTVEEAKTLVKNFLNQEVD